MWFILAIEFWNQTVTFSDAVTGRWGYFNNHSRHIDHSAEMGCVKEMGGFSLKD